MKKLLLLLILCALNISATDTFRPPQLIYKSTTAITQSKNHRTHNLYTILVPSNALVLRSLCITVVGEMSASAGEGTLTVKYGDAQIASSTIQASPANTNVFHMTLVGGNVGAPNAQSWDEFVAFPSSVAGSQMSRHTSAIDSTTNQVITVDFKGDADSITISRIVVELI